MAPGLLSHVDGIQKFSMAPQRNPESDWQGWPETYNDNVVKSTDLVIGLNNIKTNKNFIMI